MRPSMAFQRILWFLTYPAVSPTTVNHYYSEQSRSDAKTGLEFKQVFLHGLKLQVSVQSAISVKRDLRVVWM
ncbi:hypothetical protein BJ138DRAFT_1165180 [Hygrophoropsis aurantiaca]|uniref:Uncharacterized protein n=1 Tax=Hygrophoropsis aurantiaca TaxID=72124 RepID=A0ACB7ZWZ7_9AGAM|nr:hypothetical protein BJ138DRAFT_1165180 [Hygrophoropsis aurantiaca]